MPIQPGCPSCLHDNSISGRISLLTAVPARVTLPSSLAEALWGITWILLLSDIHAQTLSMAGYFCRQIAAAAGKSLEHACLCMLVLDL